MRLPFPSHHEAIKSLRLISGGSAEDVHRELIMSLLLFSPLQLREINVRNRIVVLPMLQYSAEEGFPTDWHVQQYGKLAAGGAGLVFVESTKVERRGHGTVGDLALWDDRYVAPLARIAAFIKAQGATAGIQLGHAGRKARVERPWEGYRPLQDSSSSKGWDEWDVIGPSAIAYGEGWPVPRALEHHEIAGAVAAWGDAAKREVGS